MTEINEKIKKLVEDNEVVLFMKGSPRFPQCGFSARAVQILNEIDAKDYVAINVLENNDIRQGIKVYSQWPTIPQLYIRGEFIGGSDVMQELHATGDLQKILASE
jgi:monothiol glutaredoxin